MQLLDRLNALFHYTLTTETRSEISAFLREFSEHRLAKLNLSRQLVDKKDYRIAFVGLTNVGKSTLIEALFKSKLAPRKNGPATAISTEFKYAPDWDIILHKNDNGIERLKFTQQSEVIRVLEKHVLQNDSVKSDVSLVVVQGRIELLKNSNLIIVDTPGFGSAQANSDISAAHNTNLTETLNKIDEFYFCVNGRESYISDKEISFFNKYVKHKCGTIIVNKWDEDDDKNRNEWKTRYGHFFPGCKIHFVEAKQAIKDGQGHGIDDLERIITDNSNSDNRAHKIKREILVCLEDLFHMIDQYHNGVDIKWSYPEMLSFCKELDTFQPDYKYISKFNRETIS